MKKWHVVIALLLLIVLCHWSCGAVSGDKNKEVAVRRYQLQTKKFSFGEMVGRRLKDVWSWVIQRTSGNNFVGRCIGVARKLKLVMPLMVFKMGVIITVLIFLTIFSLKSLGLLVTLLFVNTGGLFSKLTLKEHETAHQASPQNVHFHVHPDKYGSHHGYSSHNAIYSHDPWDRTVFANSRGDMDLQKRLDLLELYQRLGLSYEGSTYEANNYNYVT